MFSRVHWSTSLSSRKALRAKDDEIVRMSIACSNQIVPYIMVPYIIVPYIIVPYTSADVVHQRGQHNLPQALWSVADCGSLRICKRDPKGNERWRWSIAYVLVCPASCKSRKCTSAPAYIPDPRRLAYFKNPASKG